MNKAILHILLLIPMILVFVYPVLASQSQITEASASANHDYSQYDTKATLLEDYQNYNELLQNNPTDKTKTDIYLVNKKTEEKKFFITLSNINIEHYHSHEYRNGNLYLIKRIGDYNYPSNNWTDELWKYDYQKKGTRIASMQGLDFRVSPDEKYIAITAANKLQIIDTVTGNIKMFAIDKLSSGQEPFPGDIRLQNWSNDSQTCWIYLFAMTDTFTYTKINLEVWKIKPYSVLSLPLGEEVLLNPSTEKLVYTDLPVQISDIEINKNKKNHLYLYDFITQKQILINTSDAKAFSPIWVDDNTIEYNNPNGEGRIKYVVK